MASLPAAAGNPTDIPKIRDYFSGLVIPTALRSGKGALDDEDCRENVNAGILESIDAIRARN